MNIDERRGRQIAKKVIREMLSSVDHRRQIDEVAERYVTSAVQARYARKHARIWCRYLALKMKSYP